MKTKLRIEPTSGGTTEQVELVSTEGKRYFGIRLMPNNRSKLGQVGSEVEMSEHANAWTDRHDKFMMSFSLNICKYIKRIKSIKRFHTTKLVILHKIKVRVGITKG